MSHSMNFDRAEALTVDARAGQRPHIAPTGDRADDWSVRRRISAILRLAYRVVMKGKNRAVGSLGGGAQVAAVLLAMEIGRAHV